MTLADLPEIEIRRHLRATRLRLRVEPHKIRVTAPIFCSSRQIQTFIKQSEQWLIETWQKQQSKMAQVEHVLPSSLALFNLQQPLTVIYQTQKKSFQFDFDRHCLYISDRQPEQYLKAATIAYAKQVLPEYLTQVSHECDLPYAQCTIRQPKTRWGSCNMRHDIMLNAGLVLFPKAITRYVCVHELAHTRHFDHSPAFWHEVAKHDELYQQHRKILKQTPLPYWWVA